MPEPKYTWMQVLADKWWIGAVSLGVSLLATPLVRYVAYRKRIVDRPDDLLKPHARPVAYLGGVAMCIGLLAGLVGYLVVMPNRAADWGRLLAALGAGDFRALPCNPLWNVTFIALACVTITIVGLLDDLRDIRASRKVAGQLLAAALLLIGGVGLRVAMVFVWSLGLHVDPWVMLPFSAAICVMMVIACCNATNLLDGLDGLCGGVSAIIGVGFLVLTVWLAMWNNPSVTPEVDALRVALCLAMVGSILGFLPYNMHPASIFMGDAGSMLIGLLVATLMILFCQEGHGRWLLASLVVFAVPVMDTALAVVRRLLAGRSIFAGDRSHLYDQLIDRGMPLIRVVLLFYALSILAGGIGVLAAIYLRGRHALLLHAVLFAIVWAIFFAMGAVRERAGRASKRALRRLDVLFTSVGRRVALLQEFRRAAAELGISLRIHAVDCQPLAPGFQAADRGRIVPAIDSGGYVDALVDYCRTNGVDAVVPLIDTELAVIAAGAERLTRAGARAVVSTPEVIRVTSDKLRTHDFLVEHGFLTPHILDEQELRSPTLPVFMKPRHGSAAVRTQKVETAADLEYLRRAWPEDIVQEFVAGDEYTVDVFTDFDGAPLCAVPRRRHEVRGGEVSKSQAVRHERIVAESFRLVRELGGCRGMITIQCFLTADDRIVFIEVNPRFGGGVPLSIRAGADSPRWLLELLLGDRPDAGSRQWTDGLYMLRYDDAFFVSPEQLPEA